MGNYALKVICFLTCLNLGNRALSHQKEKLLPQLSEGLVFFCDYYSFSQENDATFRPRFLDNLISVITILIGVNSIKSFWVSPYQYLSNFFSINASTTLGFFHSSSIDWKGKSFR